MESILVTIKKLLGINDEYEAFDTDIITHINSAFSYLSQISDVLPENFSIEDETTTWNEYYTDPRLSLIKEYIYLKVKMIFDPTGSATILQNYNEEIKQLEFRISTVSETIKKEEEMQIND